MVSLDGYLVLIRAEVCFDGDATDTNHFTSFGVGCLDALPFP